LPLSTHAPDLNHNTSKDICKEFSSPGGVGDLVNEVFVHECDDGSLQGEVGLLFVAPIGSESSAFPYLDVVNS
jgi:hypothetical protein